MFCVIQSHLEGPRLLGTVELRGVFRVVQFDLLTHYGGSGHDYREKLFKYVTTAVPGQVMLFYNYVIVCVESHDDVITIT